MKLSNVVISITLLFILSGCYSPPDYYLFERERLIGIATSFNPNKNQKRREIYSEDTYIYIYRFPKEECTYGYFTNRDDKPEKVIGWIILLGEDDCKMQARYSLSLF
jgi:hypothetical protein